MGHPGLHLRCYLLRRKPSSGRFLGFGRIHLEHHLRSLARRSPCQLCSMCYQCIFLLFILKFQTGVRPNQHQRAGDHTAKLYRREFMVPWPLPTGHSLMLPSSFLLTNASLFGRTSATPTAFHSKTLPITSNSLPQSALMDALLRVLEQSTFSVLVNCHSNSPIPILSRSDTNEMRLTSITYLLLISRA